MDSPISLYLDENMQPEIAEQLRKHNIDVVTVREFRLFGVDDRTHLERATADGRVLCTRDYDFVVLASQGIEHAGIVIGENRYNIGDWVRFLRNLHSNNSAEEMINSVYFVKFTP